MQPTPADSTYETKPLIDKAAYGLVGCEVLQQLPILVNIEINDGYEPIGAPFFFAEWQRWVQAVFKRPAVIHAPKIVGARRA